MKNMTNFFAMNYGWLLLAVIGLILVVYAGTQMRKPIHVPTTKSVDFVNDPVAGTPVMENNMHANVFYEAAQVAIVDGTNPWIYLQEHWSLAKIKKGGVESALLDFIVNEAKRTIPDSSSVVLSVRDYSDPNSVVMEYRDPYNDSILVTTGHDPEPALYGTFFNKKDTVTFKLICANGLVRELGGTVETFDEDYVIQTGDTFIGVTGSTVNEATKFAKENGLPVRFVIEGKIGSKTPNTSRVKVFEDYRHFRNGVYDVVLQPGDILRKQDNKWFYFSQPIIN